MIRLLIADDHQVLLDGFISLFDDVPDIEVVGTAKHGKEVLSFLEENEVDVILLDINMPVMNGVEACKKVSKKYPEIKVIALSMYDQQSYFKRMIQYGARGYLLKNDSAEEIEKAIRKVSDDGRYVSSQMQHALTSVEFISNNQKSKGVKDISERELEVLGLIADGGTDQEIAKQLFISFHTANSHRKNLLLKFDAKNTAELVKKAIEQGRI